MELFIDGKHSIAQVQQAFTERYPFLTVDFFKPAGENARVGTRSGRIAPEENIRRFVKGGNGGVVNIAEDRTVAQVTRDLEALLTLYASILRRSGSVWVETSLTADWTLERQNLQGEHISQF